MKKILITALIGLFVLGVATTAKAVSLIPGGTVLSAGNAVPAGTLVASLLNLSVKGLDEYDDVWFTGSLDQWVYSNSVGLLFVYQVTNDATSQNAITTLSTTDYSDFTTDVDVAGVANKTISRAGAPGPTVTYHFLGIAQNTTSPKYWIQTNALQYGWGGTNLIDGGTANLKTYCPVIPEPSSMLLFGVGILGLFGLGRKRMKA